MAIIQRGDEMDTLSFFLLTAIGQTGIGTSAEIVPHVANLNRSRSDIFNTLKKMREEGLLTSSLIKFGARGNYNFSVFELSAAGHSWYVEQYQQQPVLSEAAYMRETYESMETGFLIRNICQQFVRIGRSVDHTPGTDTLTVREIKRIAHVTVITSKQEEEWYRSLFDDLYEKHNAVFFLTPNELLLYSNVKMHFFKWIGYRFRTIDHVPPGFSVGFSTYGNLLTQNPFHWDMIRF